MINFLIKLFYHKLLRYLAKCEIHHYNDILNFFIGIFQRKNSLDFFHNFVDESIKLLGPDTKFKITKHKTEIIAIVFIDDNAQNRHNLFHATLQNIEFYYCHTEAWRHPFRVDVQFWNRAYDKN